MLNRSTPHGSMYAKALRAWHCELTNPQDASPKEEGRRVEPFNTRRLQAGACPGEVPGRRFKGQPNPGDGPTAGQGADAAKDHPENTHMTPAATIATNRMRLKGSWTGQARKQQRHTEGRNNMTGGTHAMHEKGLTALVPRHLVAGKADSARTRPGLCAQCRPW